MELKSETKTRKCRVCSFVGDEVVEFVKRANLCKKCSLKRLDKISYKNSPEMREKLKAKSRAYYKNLSPEKKRAKCKRVIEMIKVRKAKKEAEQLEHPTQSSK